MGRDQNFLTRWGESQVEAGGWVRQMFQEGIRLSAEHGAGRVADLSIGQPLPLIPRVQEALLGAVTSMGLDQFGYTPNLGLPEVREFVGEAVNFEGVDASAVILTVGAAGAIVLALQTFVEDGTDVVGIAPYFPEYVLYIGPHRRFVPVPSGDHGGLDLEAIAAVLRAETGAIILNSPCNPSGHVLTEYEVAALAELLAKHRREHGRQVLVIVDEVYHDLVYEPDGVRAKPFAHWPHTVCARSMSKVPGFAGMRCGALILSPSLAANPDHIRGCAVWQRALGYVNAPVVGQVAWPLMPPDVGAARYLELRDFAYQEMAGAGLELELPEGGIYLWARIPRGWATPLEFVEALKNRLVLVVPGVAFGQPDHFRMCFATTKPKVRMAAGAIGDLILERRRAGVRPNSAGVEADADAGSRAGPSAAGRPGSP